MHVLSCVSCHLVIFTMLIIFCYYPTQIVRTLTNAVAKDGDFVSCIISPKGDYVYAVAEDHRLYCFNAISGKVDHILEVSDKDVIGIAHHPKQNIVATYGMDSHLKLWKP